MRGWGGSRIGIGGGSGHGSGGLVVVEGWEGKAVVEGRCWIEGVVRLSTEAHVAVAVLVHRGVQGRRWRMWWDRDGRGHGRVLRLVIATAEDVRGGDGGVGASPCGVSTCQCQGGGVCKSVSV